MSPTMAMSVLQWDLSSPPNHQPHDCEHSSLMPVVLVESPSRVVGGTHGTESN